MKKFLQEKSTKEKIRIFVFIGAITIFVLLGLFASVLFKGTTFANVIDNSIGKFFNFVRFFQDHYVDLLETAAIIIFVVLIEKLLGIIINISMKSNAKRQTTRALALSVIKYGSVIIAIFLILSAWGVNETTLLAGAGIIGLALSFGAQSLIEDVLCGLFIIFEKQFSVGDVIEVDDFRGTVIDVGIRITKFEDINGDIKIINNSDIRSAINTSINYSPAICDISIGYNEDLKRVEEIINNNLLKIKESISDIKEGPYYRGVQSLADSSVVLRIYAKADELKRYQVTRDLNREMKLLFDQHNINIPFPQIVVHEDKN